MNLFRNESSNPVDNAQKNLMGRTHYVDPDTLRWHKSRVLASRVVEHGLLFAITTSDALDMNNTKRGYRFVVFDVFGTVVHRDKLEDAYKRREQCDKAMWAFLNSFDAIFHTRDAIVKSRFAYEQELTALHDTVTAIEAKQTAA